MSGLDPDADGFAIDGKGVAYLQGKPVARLIQMPRSKMWAHARPGQSLGSDDLHPRREEAVDDLRRTLGLLS